MKNLVFSSPSPGRSLFRAVCPYDGQRWDRPCDQQARPSWWLRVCQCADGYHHRRDARQAAETKRRGGGQCQESRLNPRLLSIRFKQTLATYVHGHTTDTWPAVPLGLVLVVGATGLQDGLVNTTAPGNHTLNTQGGGGQSVRSHPVHGEATDYAAPSPYLRLLCWPTTSPSWSPKAAWLGSSWRRGCGRWPWRSFRKRGPVCLGRRVSPPGSRQWFPRASCQWAGRCRCSVELCENNGETPFALLCPSICRPRLGEDYAL